MSRFFTLKACLTIFILSVQSISAQVKEDKVITLVDSLPHTIGGVTVDAMGYVYVADFQETVWKVDLNGKATIYAEGFYGASGNSIDAKGNLFQANFYGNFINKVTRSGKKTVYADSLLSGPVGIAINSKNELFVCNCLTPTITKIYLDGSTEQFVQSEMLRCANGITLDNEENLYVVSFYNNNVVKISPEGEASIFATTPGKVGNGHITMANGVFYITAVHDNEIYKVTPDGKVSVFAGTGIMGGVNGKLEEATFSSPNGIATSPDQKKLYINDFNGDLLNLKPDVDHMRLRVIEMTSLAEIIKETLLSNGTKAASEQYKKLKNTQRYLEENTQPQMYTAATDLIRMNQYDLAVEMLKMNVSSYPNDIASYANMGWAYALMGKTKEAINAYEKALTYLPDNKSIKYRLSQLKQK